MVGAPARKLGVAFLLLALGLAFFLGIPKVRAGEGSRKESRPAEAAVQERRSAPPLAPRHALRTGSEEAGAQPPELVNIKAQQRSSPPGAEMPWIWRQLREVARSRLPEHRRGEFRAVFTPTIVSGPSDTVAGVGVGGRF